MSDLFFLSGLSALLIHELEAIQQEEWRFFLGWTGMSDENAYRIFTAAHFPLLVWILASSSDRPFQIGMDIFLILHAVAHTVLRNHPLIRFNTRFSQFWIYGGTVAAIAHLFTV